MYNPNSQTIYSPYDTPLEIQTLILLHILSKLNMQFVYSPYLVVLCKFLYISEHLSSSYASKTNLYTYVLSLLLPIISSIHGSVIFFPSSWKNALLFYKPTIFSYNAEHFFPNFDILIMKGGFLMEYKIIEKPAFTFAGVSKRVPLQFEGVNNEILKLIMVS